MEKRTVELTAALSLCASCGICKASCPKKCITWMRKDGMYLPVIDHNVCISCGICAGVCPGLGHTYNGNPLTGEEAVRGKVLQAYNAWSKDQKIRHVSASGGVISSLVKALLSQGAYDSAFLVGSYDYRKQLCTERVTSGDLNDITGSPYPKSRYLPVSHEKAVAYVMSHPNERVILVGTSCAVRGFLSALKMRRLKRENYLLIGLFCDRIYNYNVMDYYSQPHFCGDKMLEGLHFKNKESGGWPGNMKFFFSDGTSAYQDKTERIRMKDFFVPERCLYCIDKLNAEADISLGDNYTTQDSTPLGSNSVLIRTEQGQIAWDKAALGIESNEVAIPLVLRAQYIEGRLHNLRYAFWKQRQIKEKTGESIALNKGIVEPADTEAFEVPWKKALKMLHAGTSYQVNPQELERELKMIAVQGIGKKLRCFPHRVYHFLKRGVHACMPNGKQ